MKKTRFGCLILLLSLSIIGCSGNRSNSSTGGSENDNLTTTTSSEKDTTDYGKVYFKPIYIYADKNRRWRG